MWYDKKMALSFTEMVLHKSRRLPRILETYCCSILFFPLNTSTFRGTSTEWVNKKTSFQETRGNLHFDKKYQIYVAFKLLIFWNILSFYFQRFIRFNLGCNTNVSFSPNHFTKPAEKWLPTAINNVAFEMCWREKIKNSIFSFITFSTLPSPPYLKPYRGQFHQHFMRCILYESFARNFFVLAVKVKLLLAQMRLYNVGEIDSRSNLV